MQKGQRIKITKIEYLITNKNKGERAENVSVGVGVDVDCAVGACST